LLHIYRQFNYNHVSERILKIDQRLPKVASEVKSALLSGHRVYQYIAIYR